jgi:hypothetical protein
MQLFFVGASDYAGGGTEVSWKGGCVVDSFAVWRLVVRAIILWFALAFHPVKR